MGVYYIVVNDTKKEFVDPYCFGDNIKLGGVFQGFHGHGIAKLLAYPSSSNKYNFGYWSGDSIRVLGDNNEEESQKVHSNYKDISFYVLANVYEDSVKEDREKIIQTALQDKIILAGLIKVNREMRCINLNHRLNKLNENET